MRHARFRETAGVVQESKVFACKEIMSGQKITETHLIVISVHSLHVGEAHLVEEKKETTITTDLKNDEPRVILEHKRTVDGKSYQIFEVTEGGKVTEHQVTTDLSDSELLQFQDKWMELWNPTLPPTNTIKSLKLTKEWRVTGRFLPKKNVILWPLL